MWLRAAAVADVGRVNGPAQAYYRVHEQSMQRTIYAGYVADLEGRLDAFRKVLVGPAGQSRRGDELFAIARKALAVVRAAICAARLRARPRGAEPVDEYLAFAERVHPKARQLRQWASVARRARLEPARMEHGIAWRSRRVATDLENRLRWRHWRRSGV